MSRVITQRSGARRMPRTVVTMLAALATSVLIVGGVRIAAGSTPPEVPAAISAAVADTSRPESDTNRDADRKPGQTLAFTGAKPGDKVADFVADSGYFTRLFANVVGPKGHVYAVEPTAFFKFDHFVKAVADLQGYAVAHPTVTVTVADTMEGLHFPERLDLFWISRNYHDLHDGFMGPVDTAAFNRAVYDALKPGGVYMVLDHSAAPGAPADVTETLHRIEASTVRRELEAAGFKYESESSILANPADPRTGRVFDPAIRGRTDQFILKFTKPGPKMEPRTVSSVPCTGHDRGPKRLASDDWPCKTGKRDRSSEPKRGNEHDQDYCPGCESRGLVLLAELACPGRAAIL